MNQQVESKKLLKVLRKRKLPEFKSIEEICKFVTKFVKKQYDLVNDSEINCGYCFIWAYLVWALSKEEVGFASTDGHVVVVHNGLFFDASNPYGYEQLEDAGLDAETTAFVNVHGMAWYWARCGVAKKQFRSILRNSFNKLYNRIKVGGFNDHDPFYADMLCVDDIP